ncbi:DUF262 domain-containing protein [Thiopseudomonas alkaliphila]|uniref:DUF262 domain-containing protein n=1 Tax=Thiopseudomonas alkaliphila TaxID=1697053 RepID=UPI000ABB8BE9|nr:DUF262 domain-containing protein [Thiopseudomonas alkaliphila]
MEARNRALPDWMTRIRTRQIVLPRFQRFEAWGYGQITSLLNTVLKGLPAGAILTLDVGEKEPFLSRPITGAPEKGEKIVEHLLDGQQRLTSFWRALNDLYEDRIYLIRIEEDEDLELPYYATSVARYQKTVKNIHFGQTHLLSCGHASLSLFRCSGRMRMQKLVLRSGRNQHLTMIWSVCSK